MQGHLPNGNPVQRHSAGEHYPYVIEVRENPRIDGRYFRSYVVTGPRLRVPQGFQTPERAEDFARWCARNIHA